MFYVWKREFVCLTIFLIGAEFGGAKTVRSEICNERESRETVTRGDNFSRNARGRPFNLYRVFVPLILGLMVSGISTGALMMVKFLLLKGAFLLKSALIISGFIIAIKISDSGMLLSHYYRDFYPEKNDQYPKDEPDLSGYGYNYDYIPGYNKPEYRPRHIDTLRVIQSNE